MVHAYEEHGTACVSRLNGIFAFALWDAGRRRLVAARDQFGVKPLYWWTDGRRLALASEVGALLSALSIRPAIDRVALDHYLACRFVPAPRTLFEGISKLPAASTLVAEEGAPPRIESFREPPGRPFEGLADDELADQLAERFADAVERQMMSDVPYGAFLSGGVDSAAVVAAMAERSAAPPATFTIGFPGHGAVLDERVYASESARLIGTDHRDTAMAETDFLAELSRALPRLEEPCGIPSAPALMQLSRFAAERVKVVLAGQGADEPHGGYGRHQAAALMNLLRLVPAAAAVARRLAGPGAPAGGPGPPRRPPDRRPGRGRASAAARGDHRRARSRLSARRERRTGARTSAWPPLAGSCRTPRAGTCSSRRCTSTHACSCPTESCSATTRPRWPRVSSCACPSSTSS